MIINRVPKKIKVQKIRDYRVLTLNGDHAAYLSRIQNHLRRPERLQEPEAVDNCNDTVFSAFNKAGVRVNLKILWQYSQGLCQLKQENIAACRSRVVKESPSC